MQNQGSYYIYFNNFFWLYIRLSCKCCTIFVKARSSAIAACSRTDISRPGRNFRAFQIGLKKADFFSTCSFCNLFPYFDNHKGSHSISRSVHSVSGASERYLQRVSEDPPAAYFRGLFSMFQKSSRHVSDTGHAMCYPAACLNGFPQHVSNNSRTVFRGYSQQNFGAGLHEETHQISDVVATAFRVACGIFLTSSRFEPLGRELGTRRKQQDSGGRFLCRSNLSVKGNVWRT